MDGLNQFCQIYRKCMRGYSASVTHDGFTLLRMLYLQTMTFALKQINDSSVFLPSRRSLGFLRKPPTTPRVQKVVCRGAFRVESSRVLAKSYETEEW